MYSLFTTPYFISGGFLSISTEQLATVEFPLVFGAQHHLIPLPSRLLQVLLHGFDVDRSGGVSHVVFVSHEVLRALADGERRGCRRTGCFFDSEAKTETKKTDTRRNVRCCKVIKDQKKKKPL